MESSSYLAIYQIRNVATGKLYIGSAINYRRRKVEHFRDLRRGTHNSKKLQAAWNKYGEGAFVFEVLEPVDRADALIDREQFWIDRMDAVRSGYNVSPRAGSLLGFIHSEETKTKMKQAHKGKPKAPEHVEKVREALRGRKMTREQCQKMREAKLGKKQGPHSEETKRKMSEASIGVAKSQEHKAALSRAKTGKPWSEARWESFRNSAANRT